MVGLGEACTHFATVLFAVDTTVKIRDSKAVTQEPAHWLLAATHKEVRYIEVGDIDFTSVLTNKKKLDEAIATGSSVPSRIRQPRNIPAPSPAELDICLSGLSLGASKPVVLSLVSAYSDGFVPKQAQVAFPALAAIQCRPGKVFVCCWMTRSDILIQWRWQQGLRPTRDCGRSSELAG